MPFKRNITVTMACISTEMLLCVVPLIIITYVFFVPEELNELFMVLLLVLRLAIIINVALAIVSLIACIFLKTKYYVKKEGLLVETKQKSTLIPYNQVCTVLYDFGDLSSKLSSKPSCLVLLDEQYGQLLTINNPPIVLVHLIKAKCKKARKAHLHNKRFLFFLVCIHIAFWLALGLIKIFCIA